MFAHRKVCLEVWGLCLHFFIYLNNMAGLKIGTCGMEFKCDDS